MHKASRLPAAGSLPVVATLLGLCLWLTDHAAWQRSALGFSGLYLIRTALLGLAAAVMVLVFARFAVRSSCSARTKRLWLAIVAGGLTVLVLEGVFMFVPRSHDVGYTLGAKVWTRYYWRPENSLGYRDREHVAVAGKHLVFALGDSFTAGGGLPDVAARYSELLAARRPDLQVLNLGKNGSDTLDAWQRLLKHPLEPAAVILQYTPNDIEGAAMQAGRHPPAFTPYRDLAWPAAFLVRNSFLLNFVYWHFPHSDADAYEQFFEHALIDDAVVQRHLADLEQFGARAASRGFALVVVVFPLLQDLEQGRATRARVLEMFRRKGFPVVDVAELVKDLDAGQRMVNPTDAHPSALVHRLVAAALARVIAHM